MKLMKAELARKLKVSPAYVTMVCGGQRVLSKRLMKKVNKLGLTNEFKNTTLNQQVTGSTPVRLTTKLGKQLTWSKSQSWDKSESNQLTKQNNKLCTGQF